MSEELLEKQRAFFLDVRGRQIFAQIHEPEGSLQLREGVVICAPAPQETRKTHWMQRQIAQRLAQAGYTTLRFDYSASGDSEGPSSAFDLDRCREDIAHAIAYLKGSGLVRRITVLGIRLGAALALDVCEEERVKRLVLIDPILDGAAYLASLRSFHSTFTEGHPYQAPFVEPRTSEAQAMGFPLSPLLAWQLEALRATTPQNLKLKSLQLIQSAGAPSLAAWLAPLSQGEAALDEVQCRQVDEQLHWDRPEALSYQFFPNALIHAIVDAVKGQS